MWVNLEVVASDENILYLPMGFIKKLDELVTVRVGKKGIQAEVFPSRNLIMKGENSFENPLKIKISSKLVSLLCLPVSLTYQMKYNKSNLIIGPTIGMLLGRHNYLYCPSHMKKYSDRFGVYDQVGGLIYAFSYRTIDWDNKVVYGLYYDNTKEEWLYGKFPLPSVIYRRDFHTDPEIEKKLVSSIKGRMFNSWRFTKLFLYEHVKNDNELVEYLPITEETKDYEQVKLLIDKEANVILKPNNLSRGRGICIIKKKEEAFKVFDYRNRAVIETELVDENALKEFFENNKEFFDNYLIQKHLELAKVDGGAFDIRVVMQKENLTQWKCTGIECRVAAKKTLVTNISKGGYALTLDKALESAFSGDEEKQKGIKEHLNVLCQKLCKSLEGTGKHFAEFGIDIGVDVEGRLWIIEVNVFPSFKGFKTMNYDTYLEIRRTPILYAARLAGFKINPKEIGTE
jgi:glutathione synthase/RimK-type ligase-like ATP-grasp enzyme